MNLARHTVVHHHCSRASDDPATSLPHPARRRVALWTVAAGGGALLWLLLRTGPKPSRFTYPCQQWAFGVAAAAFGGPFVAATLAGRAQVLRFVHSGAGRISLGLLAVSLLVLSAVASYDPVLPAITATPPADYHPDVYFVSHARGVEPGRFGGVDDLTTLMGVSGLKWHRSQSSGPTWGPDGLIAADDVALIKVNAQWAERGGTNTDVLRGIIRRIVEHPDGFVGEIIVADNGQGYGSLDRPQNNAEDPSQSSQDVVDEFAAEGWNISAQLWDGLRVTSVGEYAEGDMADGYVVSASYDPETNVRVSYPKFRSAFGTYISYKYGPWDPGTASYAPDKLVVVNVPVLKTHVIYAVTASVKNHMGVVTQRLSTDSHNAVGRGGLGSVLAEVRMPDLTILDCIWILARPGSGPSAPYGQASRMDQLVASADPVALDAWAVKYVLIPQIIANGYGIDDFGSTQDPDNPNSTFRQYLDRSMNEMLLAGIDTTNDYGAVNLHEWLCGDGALGAGEDCDDGNTTPGDGCSAACQVETCFQCVGEPSACTCGGSCVVCLSSGACTDAGGTCECVLP